MLWTSLVIGACGAPIHEPVVEPRLGLAVAVVEVVDGDTVRVDALGDEHVVRLLGIDTPEKPGGPRPAECGGTEATDALTALLPAGSRLWLSREVETRDQYGRLLAWARLDDGRFVNALMIEQGLAVPLFFRPNDRLENTFVASSREARRAGLGLWANCGGADRVLDEADDRGQ